MAVVSISRIQIRRGRKNQGSGLPQLASGELGWAVDTQELYIGNGSVAEGAPLVGNTKLLSENDDLFQFADSYTYKKTSGFLQTGEGPNTPVIRSLQERLDDRVSIRSFGAPGDGTDQTAALQRALDQLYLNPANKGTAQARVELILEPGEYRISSTVYVPPFATIRGAGSDKTVIIAGAHTAFKTVNEASSVGSYADDAVSTTLNQARNIHMSGLTITTQGTPAFELVSCKDSYFEDIKITGTWAIGDTVSRTNVAMTLTGLSTPVTCQNNIFNKIKISGYAYAILSDRDINNNTWENCEFDTHWAGIVWGETTILGNSGQLTGPTRNIIKNSTFDDIMSTAIRIYTGPDNISTDNKFYNVGNDGGTPANNIYPVIQFDANFNTSDNDYFQRSTVLGTDARYFVGVEYRPEITGSQITQINRTNYINLTQYTEKAAIFKLPAEKRKGYVIDYTYKSNQVTASRTGTINLVIDPDNQTYSLSDEYDYTGDSQWRESVQFSAEPHDEDLDGEVDTFVVKVLNSISSDQADFYYTIRYK